MTTTVKLTDKMLEQIVERHGVIYDHDQLISMARELLAHRRASQAAPAPSDALREAAEMALRQMEDDAVKIEAEWERGRSLEKLELDGDLPPAITALRAALSTPTEERQ